MKYLFFNELGEIWMIRRYLIPFSLRTRSLPNIYLHHFLGKDTGDQTFHDHGRWCLSIILWGGYVEEREAGAKLHRGWLSVKLQRANEMHKVISSKPNTWTLFIVGPIKRLPHIKMPHAFLRLTTLWPDMKVPATAENIAKLQRRQQAAARFKRRMLKLVKV